MKIGQLKMRIVGSCRIEGLVDKWMIVLTAVGWNLKSERVMDGYEFYHFYFI